MRFRDNPNYTEYILEAKKLTEEINGREEQLRQKYGEMVNGYMRVWDGHVEIRELSREYSRRLTGLQIRYGFLNEDGTLKDEYKEIR